MAAQPDNSKQQEPVCSDAGRFGIEAVHFSKKSYRETNVTARTWQIPLFGLMLAGMACVSLFTILGTPVGLTPQRAASFVLVPILIAYVGYRIREARFDLRFDRTLDPAPDPGSRLCCVGRREDLAKRGEFVDVPFEPILFTGYFSDETKRHMDVVGLMLTLIFGALFWFYFPMSNPTAMNRLLFVMWFSIASSSLIVAWLWPTYFRVMPGRLEVMRFSTLRGRAISFERFDMRQAWVLVDLRRSVVFINEGKKRAEYAIGLMRGRTCFAHALFWAAMNTHQAPELPEDRLLG